MRERAPPRRWVIEGEAEGGGSAIITYRLTAQDGGTRFERELVYRMPNLWLAVLNRLFIQRRMAAEFGRGAAPPEADPRAPFGRSASSTIVILAAEPRCEFIAIRCKSRPSLTAVRARQMGDNAGTAGFNGFSAAQTSAAGTAITSMEIRAVSARAMSGGKMASPREACGILARPTLFAACAPAHGHRAC